MNRMLTKEKQRFSIGTRRTFVFHLPERPKAELDKASKQQIMAIYWREREREKKRVSIIDWKKGKIVHLPFLLLTMYQ